MAKKTKEVKPIPALPAILGMLAFLAIIVVFLMYLLSPNNNSEISHVDSLGDQSFEEESSIAPPPPVVSEVVEYMSDAKVGDVVEFGVYEQNGNADDGAEPIEWVVVSENEDNLILVSRYCLDCVPYNQTRVETDWEKSSLRQWLNNEFYNNAFSQKEKSGIVAMGEALQIDNSDGGESLFLEDNVSILSVTQAKSLYEYDSWRVAEPTQYAINNGAHVENGYCWWWLRNNLGSADNQMAKYVHFNGGIYDQGFAVDFNSVAVRPVICVSANAEKESHQSEDESSEISESSDVLDVSDISDASATSSISE